MKKHFCRKRLISLCCICLAVMSFAACGGTGTADGSSESTTASQSVSEAPAEGAVYTETKEGVTVTLKTDKSVYAAGEEVHYTLTVTNETEDWNISGRKFQYTNSVGLVALNEDSLPDNLPSLRAGESCTIEGTLTGGAGEKVSPELANSSTTVSLRPYVMITYDGKEEMVRCVLNLKMTQLVREFDKSEKKTPVTVSVHDPSIFKDKDGRYYLFGTHITSAASDDLFDWTDKTSQFKSALSADVKSKIRAWNKDDSAGSWFGYLWAPDIIYNEEMGKYCIYLSANGDDWKSNIVLLTADALYGPYDYAGTVVYGGFNAKNFGETDAPKVLGVEEIPNNYVRNGVDNRKWGDKFPNCIDPCVFYDEEGQLWMSYGSWSGGIFMLKLDEKTGLRDYSAVYETSKHSDAYFGKLIAGGCYVSGEGSYIQRIGDYYYLFISYGNLEAKGGYNMRVFRSDKPDGEYVDLKGNSAYYDTYLFNYNDPCGIRLFGGYKWPTMIKAQVAQGHNSAFVDDDGKAYIIYHTRTNDGSEGHFVKVHQIFTTKDGWLVAAPYATDGETLNESGYSASEVAGSYEVILHELDIDYKQYGINMAKKITLSEDGTVSGAYTGTWSLESGTPYITIELDGEVYSGVTLRQNIEGSNVETMTFTALGESNQLTLWGSRAVD